MHQINCFSPDNKEYVVVKGKITGGVTKIENSPIEISIYVDSSTSISIIDHDFTVHILGLYTYRTRTIKLRRIGNGLVSKYIIFHLYIKGINKFINVVVYLYKGFVYSILLGNDTIIKYSINVITAKHVISIGEVEIPFIYKAALIKATEALDSVPVNFIYPNQSNQFKLKCTSFAAFVFALPSLSSPRTHVYQYYTFVVPSNRKLRRYYCLRLPQ